MLFPLDAAEHQKQNRIIASGCLRVKNAEHRPSSRSACFAFEAQGIGIENTNKLSGVFFFGTFLLDKQKKDTCCRSATGSPAGAKSRQTNLSHNPAIHILIKACDIQTYAPEEVIQTHNRLFK